ncbi:MAG: hypothetical protein K2G89_06325 [Lachnospiraceae bacterium]|nr:hypothetical protein [Lachnospiraceae bacterium]
MKKKLICTAIILTMITSLTACGSNADSNVMSDDGSMTESEEIATKDEAENETDMVVANVTSSTYNKDNVDNSTNNPAATTSQSANSDSKTNTSTESRPTTEAPRQDSQTTTEAPAATEQPATTEAPAAPATEPEKECPRSSTGKHMWYDHYKTITVVDQEAYDEKTPTGEYQTKTEKHMYASAYTKNPETGMNTYVCDIDVTGMNVADARAYLKSMGYDMGNTWSDYVTVTDYDNPIYNTVHHDAVTHTERVLDYTDCTVCGARK